MTEDCLRFASFTLTKTKTPCPLCLIEFAPGVWRHPFTAFKSRHHSYKQLEEMAALGGRSSKVVLLLNYVTLPAVLSCLQRK